MGDSYIAPANSKYFLRLISTMLNDIKDKIQTSESVLDSKTVQDTIFNAISRLSSKSRLETIEYGLDDDIVVSVDYNRVIDEVKSSLQKTIQTDPTGEVSTQFSSIIENIITHKQSHPDSYSGDSINDWNQTVFPQLNTFMSEYMKKTIDSIYKLDSNFGVLNQGVDIDTISVPMSTTTKVVYGITGIVILIVFVSLVFFSQESYERQEDQEFEKMKANIPLTREFEEQEEEDVVN